MLSALKLARAVEAGELTPAQVVDQCADAIAKREGDVGAFAALDIEAARKAAQAPSLKGMPLHGLPFGIKDIFDTADLVTEYGSSIYPGHRPRYDSSFVALIRRAGGLVIGKTVTTEFAHLDPGKTRNPHNREHTPGGSSSGSAAGVAAGFFPVATGTQTGGSVIRPAAFCGVAGFKPSYRLYPTIGMKCVSWHLDTAGLFAASVADVAFAAAAIASRDDLRVDGKTPAAPRIGVLRDQPWPAASPDMTAAVERTAKAAEAKGARVRDVRLGPGLTEAFKAHSVIQAYEAARSLASEYERAKDKLAKGVLDLVETGFATSNMAYDDARRVASQARGGLSDLFADIDVLLSPSAPGAAPKGLGSTGSSTFNRLWTLMGTPCVSVPGAIDPSGMPLGIQVTGPFGRDRGTLEAAHFIESLIHRSA
jgi:Asp-tRNA(Asn)/Glu-tRNA(Gln) amidotransferase A subunit family amidase